MKGGEGWNRDRGNEDNTVWMMRTNSLPISLCSTPSVPSISDSCCVGDHGRDQVVNLHYMLSKASVRTRPSVLWCYKKDLGFTSHRQKRMRKIKRDISRGIRSAEDAETPFELFVSSTDIRYCYYKETHKILGQTFGMCVLQDFPALTPNLLARTIETVEGGGLL